MKNKKYTTMSEQF